MEGVIRWVSERRRDEGRGKRVCDRGGAYD